MATSKSHFGKICLAASSVLAAGFALWRWSKQRQRLRAVVKLSCINKHVVHVVNSAKEWEHCLPQILHDTEKYRILGLDCEWVMKRPVAMLQIATQSGFCVLIRLCKMDTSNIPESLQALLADRRILKLGVSVNDDAKKLMRDYRLQVNGCVDLRHILNRTRMYKCHSWGLQGLAKCVLGINLSKDSKIRCGNWEAQHLSPDQIEYAALDALVAVDIFTHLVWAKILGQDPRLHPQMEYIEPMAKFLSTVQSLCQGVVDKSFVWKSSAVGNAIKPVKVNDRKQSGDMYSRRKRPLWDNCELLAPDGQPLCTCDARKAAWYITKGLGEKVSDSPLTVKLKFEPAGRPKSGRNYYLQQKDNKCVVCGATDSYARKFVVPQEYRKYFPLLLKEHTSHDVLLMCPPCHRVSSDHDGVMRSQLAVECGAPLNSGENSSFYQDHFLQQVKSAGRALLLKRENIPKARMEELERILFDFYGAQDITVDILNDAANLDVKQVRQNYTSHAQGVVEYMAENGGLLQFQVRWRRHFIQTMNPQHLPAFWSVDYVPENWGAGENDKDDDSQEEREGQWEEEDEEEEEYREIEEEEDSDSEEVDEDEVRDRVRKLFDNLSDSSSQNVS